MAEEEKQVMKEETTEKPVETPENKEAKEERIEATEQYVQKRVKSIVFSVLSPKMIKENVPKADADAWKKKLEDAGAKVSLK